MFHAPPPPNRVEVRIGLADKPRVVEWPVVETSNSSMLVRTPGGDIWMSAEKWRAEGAPRLRTGDLCTPEFCDAAVEAVLQFLRKVPWVRENQRVPVQSVKDGASSLSRKIKLRVVVEEAGREPRTLTRARTVPASQLKLGSDGVWTLPKWIVGKDILAPGEKVWMLPWEGMAAIEAELRVASVLAKADVMKAQQDHAELQARQQIEYEQRVAAQIALETTKQARDAELRHLAAEDGEFALAFAKLRYTLSELAERGVRLDRWPRWIPADGVDAAAEGSSVICGPKAYHVIGRIVEAARKHQEFASWRERNKSRAGALLKPAPAQIARVPDAVIDDCTVEWTEWVGSSSKRERVDYRQEGCKVEVFGKKHVIELPDGTVVTKMAGPNLKIIPTAAGKAMELPSNDAASSLNG